MNKITKLGKDTYSHYDNDTGEIFVFRVGEHESSICKAVKLNRCIAVAESGDYFSKNVLLRAIQDGYCVWDTEFGQSKTKDPHAGARRIWEEWKKKQDELIVETMCEAHEKLIGTKKVADWDKIRKRILACAKVAEKPWYRFKEEYDKLVVAMCIPHKGLTGDEQDLNTALFKDRIDRLKTELTQKYKKIEALEDELALACEYQGQNRRTLVRGYTESQKEIEDLKTELVKKDKKIRDFEELRNMILAWEDKIGVSYEI